MTSVEKKDGDLITLTKVNGYPVLAQGPMRLKTSDSYKGRIVLCFRDDRSFHRFVVWTVWSTDAEHYDVSHGQYVEGLGDAWKAFNERAYGEVL